MPLFAEQEFSIAASVISCFIALGTALFAYLKTRTDNQHALAMATLQADVTGLKADAEEAKAEALTAKAEREDCHKRFDAQREELVDLRAKIKYLEGGPNGKR